MKFMEFVPQNTNIPFIPKAKLFLSISGVLVFLALVSLLVFGLNYGIDFAGGTEILVQFNQKVNPDQIRAAMAQKTGLTAEVQNYGSDNANQVIIKLANISYVTPEREAAVHEAMKSAFAEKGLRRFHHSSEGGDKIEFTLNEQVSTEEVKKILAAADSPASDITVGGGEGRYTYRCVLEGLTPHIEQALAEQVGAGTFKILRLDTVGPKVGAELKSKSMLTILYCLLGMLIYIAFRFDFRFAPGAIIALIHDTVICVGVYAALGLEFTIPTIAALLTLAGYSINDTIVVYDRIRENLSKTKTRPMEEVFNEAINQTLSRTIMTSFVTLLAVGSMLIFGGSVILDFSLVMFIGIIVGTYSSIFVASPLSIYLYRFLEQRQGAKAGKATA